MSVFAFQKRMDDYLKIEKIGEGWSQCYVFLDGKNTNDGGFYGGKVMLSDSS